MNTLAFLREFMDQEIYLIKEKPLEYSDQAENDEFKNEVSEIDTVYEGSNSKGVIIIIKQDTTDNEMNLLDNILSSVQLKRNDVAVIRINDSSDDLIEKLANIESTKILSFGVYSGKSRLLDIQTKYAPASVSGKTVIMADSLSHLLKSKELKRKLWNSLKEIF